MEPMRTMQTNAAFKGLLATVLSTALTVGCGDDRSLNGLQCGGRRCAQGQVCCIDCDGTGACLSPGASCPGLRCLPRDAGSERDAGGNVDGGVGTRCGDTTCEPRSVCCIACDGRGTCGSPGLNCPGYGCFPDAGTSAACTPEG